MNSRERILAAVSHKKYDRVPTDIWATSEVWDMLSARFGDYDTIREQLHIDGIAFAMPEYIGPTLPELGKDEAYDIWSYWGTKNRRVSYGTGHYDEQIVFPLAHARTIDELESHRWPDADWFDYRGLRERVKKIRENQAVNCGYMAPFYFHNALRGLEQSLVDPYDDPEFTQRFLQLECGFIYEYHRRIFETCEGLIDFCQVTDDFGSQSGPLISLQTFRDFYKPHMQKMIDLCHASGIKVFHHDDGAMRTFLPDLVDMGIDVLNPIQHTCPGMDMKSLKDEFGDKICFHGAVENQQILPFGTVDEVRAEVRNCIDSLASDGTGYILAPCHNLQSVTPLENIVAMYDEAWNYGRR